MLCVKKYRYIDIDIDLEGLITFHAGMHTFENADHTCILLYHNSCN